MQPHPLPRSITAAAPLAGGDGATPPPVAPTATARPPRAVATDFDAAFVEKAAAEAWFYDRLDVIDDRAFDTLEALGEAGLIRRWVAHTTSQERAEQTAAILREWAKKTATRAPIPVERRLVDERPLFTPTEIAEIEAEVKARIALPAGPDRWPATGGDAFRALTDRDWHDGDPAPDDLPGPWQAIVLVSLIIGFAVAFGIGLARLVAVLL